MVDDPARAVPRTRGEAIDMTTRTAATLCSLVGAVSLLGAAPAHAAQGGGYAGTWTSTDTDGSHQVMRISGSGKGSYGLRLYDDAGTVCGGVPTLFNGSGHLVPDGLVALGSVACLPGGNVLHGAITLFYAYDQGTDTITDGAGVVWTRA